jgi:hypothetical protein
MELTWPEECWIKFCRLLIRGNLIDQILKPSLITRHMRKALPRPMVPYEGKARDIRTDEGRLTPAEMCFKGWREGYLFPFGYYTNHKLTTEIQISQTTNFTQRYGINWTEHVERMSSDRIFPIPAKI